MEVSIQANHLRAAACCAAMQDIRYYLNGALVEVRATETRIVATDGNMAAVLRDEVLVGRQEPMPDVIIPNATIKLALGLKSKVLSLVFDAEGKKWSLGGIPFTPCDGLFPAYRRIVPCTHTGEAAQFNPEFIAAFAKIGKALGTRNNPIIRHNGSGAAQVSFYGFENEFVGVLMPLRAFTEKHPDPGLIQWGHEQAK